MCNIFSGKAILLCGHTWTEKINFHALHYVVDSALKGQKRRKICTQGPGCWNHYPVVGSAWASIGTEAPDQNLHMTHLSEMFQRRIAQSFGSYNSKHYLANWGTCFATGPVPSNTLNPSLCSTSLKVTRLSSLKVQNNDLHRFLPESSCVKLQTEQWSILER
jgi:hypothetical protein